MYGNDASNFITTFFVCALLSGTAFVYLMTRRTALSVQL